MGTTEHVILNSEGSNNITAILNNHKITIPILINNLYSCNPWSNRDLSRDYKSESLTSNLILDSLKASLTEYLNFIANEIENMDTIHQTFTHKCQIEYIMLFPLQS